MKHILFLCLVSMLSMPMVSATVGLASRGFIENKGQIGDQHGRPNDRVRYLVVRPGLHVQLRTDGFSYDSYMVDDCGVHEPANYYFHRIDVDLVDADPQPRITATDPAADHLHYYTHITAQRNGEQGATGVRGFARVTYHDVWPNIDMEWFLDDRERPEYQFIVRPGGNVAQIRLRYRGAEDAKVEDGVLLHTVRHGIVREHIPASYLAASGTQVDVRYALHSDGTVGFALPPTNLALNDDALVIDPLPELVWGSYYGGDMVESVHDVMVTPMDGVVMVGRTGSTMNIATQGAHQTDLTWLADAFVVHFDSAMRRTWATYYGGRGTDDAIACALMRDGSIVVAGTTSSAEGIATIGTHQTTYSGIPASGEPDGFVAVLASNGERLWGTYAGGEDGDRPNDVTVLPTDDVVIVGETSSTTGIATPGTHQGGFEFLTDAFMMMFDASGRRTWGTYYGKRSSDRATGVASTADGTIIVVGETRSDGFATPDCHQPLKGDNSDAFIAAFRSDGTRAWGTYFGGRGYELAEDVHVTPAGDIVVVGTTWGSDMEIATAGTHRRTSLPTSGGGTLKDGFLATFTSAGVQLWGTLYGGDDVDEVDAVATTPHGDIVVCGRTQSTKWVASVDAHQTVYGGGSYDACVAGFSSTGRMLWGTYYGGSRDDRATSTAVTSTGRVVLVGVTESPTSIATSGALQDTLHRVGSSGQDGFLAVFRDQRTVSVDAADSDRTRSDRPWISVHPNPAVDVVQVTTSTASSAMIEVIDAMGRVVTTHGVQPEHDVSSIDVSGLTPGLYMLRLRTPEPTQLHTTYLVVGAR
jgi:hypothetical protein